MGWRSEWMALKTFSRPNNPIGSHVETGECFDWILQIIPNINSSTILQDCCG